MSLTASQLRDLNVEVAERLSTSSDVVPSSDFGMRVLTLLKASCPAPTDPHPSSHNWGKALTPGWGQTPETLAIEGLVRLAKRDDWRQAHPQVRASLMPLLGSPAPVYRFLATEALPALLAETEDLVDTVAGLLSQEADPHIAACLLVHLGSVASSEAERIDQVLRSLEPDARWAVLTNSPAGDRKLGPSEEGSVAVNLLSHLALVHETSYAASVLDAWATKPTEHPERVQAVICWLRDALNPPRPVGPIRDRAFAFTKRVVEGIHSSLGEPSDSDDRLHINAAAVAVSVSQNLYFASGAFEAKPGIQSTNQRGDTRDFALRAFPLLDQLADVPTPKVTHHIVQIISHIADTNPERALEVTARAVSNDPAYWREPMAVETTVAFIRRIAVEHRDIVSSNENCTTALRTLLECFVRLGWDQALAAAEQLDEMFD